MYAVIETGGKQYRVQPGDFIAVEKLSGDVGSSVKFNQVLLLSKPGETSLLWLGKPYVGNASVEAEVVGQGRGEKIYIVKVKRRKGYRKTQGHRQELTQILVTAVDNGAGEKASLSAEDKKKKLERFLTALTPKGGRVREAQSAEALKSAQSEKSAAPKKVAKAPAKAASKSSGKSTKRSEG